MPSTYDITSRFPTALADTIALFENVSHLWVIWGSSLLAWGPRRCGGKALAFWMEGFGEIGLSSRSTTGIFHVLSPSYGQLCLNKICIAGVLVRRSFFNSLSLFFRRVRASIRSRRRNRNVVVHFRAGLETGTNFREFERHVCFKWLSSLTQMRNN